MSLNIRYRNREFKRYEHKFLDCEKVLVISHLDHCRAPVEWLFFLSYENTNEILDHCINQKRRWWEYPSKLTRNTLPLIGARLNSLRFATFKQAEGTIHELIDKRKLVLFRVDTFYQPNRPNYLVEHRQGHMVAIKDYEAKVLSTEFLMLDDLDIKDLSKLYVDREVVEQMYNHSLFNEIFYLDYDENFEIDKDNIMTLFEVERRKIKSDPNAIPRIERFMKEDRKSLDNSTENFLYLSDAFKLLSGSRELFSRFLKHISFNETMVSEVQKCAELAEIIYLSFIRSSLTGRLSRSLLDVCTEYFDREEAIVKAILSSGYAERDGHPCCYQEML